jgi:hypothetical protein
MHLRKVTSRARKQTGFKPAGREAGSILTGRKKPGAMIVDQKELLKRCAELFYCCL